VPGILILVLALVPCRSVAEEGAGSGLRNSILRVDVPADRPDVWFGDARSLIAVPREEFEQLLKEAEPTPPGPRPVQITSARYTATLAGQALRDGRGQLTVQRVGEDPVLLPLGEFNVAVRDFSWTDREAIWGSDRTGQSWLKVDTPSGDLQWSWSAAGRLFAGELNFDLQFPAAAISMLDVRVPRDQAVRSLPEARRLEEGSDAQWQVWRIQLGSDRRCRLAVMRAEPAAARSPTVLYDYELGAVVREQDLRFQSVFQVEVFDAPATELTFTVPLPRRQRGPSYVRSRLGQVHHQPIDRRPFGLTLDLVVLLKLRGRGLNPGFTARDNPSQSRDQLQGAPAIRRFASIPVLALVRREFHRPDHPRRRFLRGRDSLKPRLFRHEGGKRRGDDQTKQAFHRIAIGRMRQWQ